MKYTTTIKKTIDKMLEEDKPGEFGQGYEFALHELSDEIAYILGEKKKEKKIILKVRRTHPNKNMYKITVETKGKQVCILVKEKDKNNSKYMLLLWEKCFSALNKRKKINGYNNSPQI